MPTVSAIFSGGVSVGLLAGVVSGLFYLVVAGIRWAGEVKQQSEEWLFRQVQRRLRLQPAAACICSADDGAGMEPETVHVREFIERLVESLVSGELDNVCIKRLHSHAEYDRMFACHHGPLCEALARLSFALQMAMANKHMAGQDSPSAAHAALKQLIQQIVQEAMDLPKFKGVKPVDDMKSLEDMSSKTYEDILATAILNKVIERYQQSGSVARGSMDGNSNLLSPELMSLVAMHQPKQLTSGESGLHPNMEMNDHRYFLNDGDTMSDLSNTDPLSVTIEECIEEVTTFSNAEDDDAGDSDSGIPGLNVFKKRRAPFPEYGRDIIDGPPVDVSNDGEEDEEEEESEDESSLQPTDVINPVDSWEENWLFQKRRLKVGGVQQPMPVPMLVPNPSEDYRALIGDRDAEDVSDLSDCSDGALEDVVLAEDSVPNPSGEIIPTSDLDAEEDNLVEDSVDGRNAGTLELKQSMRENTLSVVEKPLIVLNDVDQELSDDVSDLTEAKNMEYLKANSDDCMSEFGQQEGEYTEDYAAVTQRRQMDSLTETSDADSQEVPELPSTPIPQLSSEASPAESVAAILDSLAPGELIPEDASVSDVITKDLVQPPRPGTIAEREHKKWETAPPLPNNPYSPENIIKRLNKKHTFVRTNSSGDASIEFPELNEVDSKEKVAPPLQVVCSPSDVDYKRYGRDYYINAEPAAKGKKRQNSSESSTPEDAHEVSNSHLPQRKNSSSDLLDSKEINNIESKVAIWQKEINQADQYYKNMLNKRQELLLDSSGDNADHVTNSSFHKSVLKNNDCDSSKEISKTTKKQVKERLQDLEKKEVNISHVAMEKFVTECETKSDLRNRKLDIHPETLELPQGHLGNIIQTYENGIDTYSNGYSRSNSPSGSSILTSDGEYNMPSVRELTKRFAGLNPSDSSASTSKSVSPAPPVSRGERLSRERDDEKQEIRKTLSSLSPPRTVREIHSLTARSISREFREELRHNHPVPLNKNVYKQTTSTHSNGSSNGIAEENSISSNTSLSSPPRSPLPHRSMQSSIAFWEKMQNKS